MEPNEANNSWIRKLIEKGAKFRFVELKTGITMHVVDIGKETATPLILCHGWPECWYSWRHQILPLYEAGFRVIVPDQRGFNKTSCPPERLSYRMQVLLQDLVALMESLHIPRAVYIGHDWGGAVVWYMGLHYPERVIGIIALNTPYMPADPSFNPLEAMRAHPGRFDYQMYFQEEGVAEAEFEKNVPRTLKSLVRSSKAEDKLHLDKPANTSNVRERGGMLVGLPEEVPRSIMFTAEDLDYYVSAYQRSRFRGGLNWYRNIEENWKFNLTKEDKKIRVPSLMVTVDNDQVLKASMSQHMEEWVPSLSRAHIQNCSHWTQQDEPEETTRVILQWLQKSHSNL